MTPAFWRLPIGTLSAALAFWSAAAQAGGPQPYATRCAACHGASGEGRTGLAPRLNERTSKIAAKPEGRRYLVMVLLNGLFGAITVDGKRYNGMMAPVATMSDQDIASLLTEMVSMGKAGKRVSAFTAAEVAKVRAEGKHSFKEVAAERAHLAEKGIIP